MSRNLNINIDFNNERPIFESPVFRQNSGDDGGPQLGSFDSYAGSNPTDNLESQIDSAMSDLKKVQAELAKLEGQLEGNGESKYGSASGSSTGDPHLSFDGGSTDKKWDDMGSHKDLVDANSSFRGGYQVSTTSTGLNSNNVAYNKSATISTGDDRDTVTMGPGGQVMVLQDGQNLDLQKGQSIKLDSGAIVSESQDGTVTVNDNNNHGGNMSTTMKWNGQGVDVNFNSQNTYLGGDLVDQNPGVMA